MDRATKLLKAWSETYKMLLAAGAPEEDVIAGVKGALDFLAVTDPEFYEEIIITARFEKMLIEEDEE